MLANNCIAGSEKKTNNNIEMLSLVASKLEHLYKTLRLNWH